MGCCVILRSVQIYKHHIHRNVPLGRWGPTPHPYVENLLATPGGRQTAACPADCRHMTLCCLLTGPPACFPLQARACRRSCCSGRRTWSPPDARNASVPCVRAASRCSTPAETCLAAFACVCYLSVLPEEYCLKVSGGLQLLVRLRQGYRHNVWICACALSFPVWRAGTRASARGCGQLRFVSAGAT